MKRRYLPAALGVTAAIAFAWGFYELAEDLATSKSLKMFDAIMSAMIQSLRTPALTTVMKVITFSGDTLAVSVATAILVFALAYKGRRRQAIFSAIAVIAGAGMGQVLKDVFGRTRPPASNALITLPSSFSFPSGHAIGSLCLAWVLSYAAIHSSMSRRAKTISVSACVIYMLLVGMSRVYLGVHWPSDVLASWFLGGAMISLSTGIYVSYRLGREQAS